MVASTSSCRLQEIPQFIEFERAVKNEFEAAGDQEDLILRSSTALSALLKEIVRQHALPYFRYIIGDALERTTRGIDATITCANSLVSRLCKSTDRAPLVLRSVCQYMLDMFQKHFPSSTNGVRIIVGNFLILRILCPMLVKPQLVGLKPHKARTLGGSILLAKLLQHTLRGTPIESLGPQVDVQNAFIKCYTKRMGVFLNGFSSDLERISVTASDIESRSIVYNNAKKSVYGLKKIQVKWKSKYRGLFTTQPKC